MLANKIMIFLGMALVAILVIENMIFNQVAYLFWMYSNVGIVLIVVAGISFFIGFGFRGILQGKDNKYENDSYDF